MERKSEIIVLIPHYNNFYGLLKSINSINELIPIDVLVVDDGSMESIIIETTLHAKCPNNVNIHVIYNSENKGIEVVLNQGLDYIRTKNYQFVARLDCGDTNAKNRLKTQADYLLNHPGIGIVGSFVRFNDVSGKCLFDLKLPTTNKYIQNKMYFNSMFIHPSIMITHEVLHKVKRYPIHYPAAEDYAYFFEILKYFKGANIDEILVFCEANPNGISITRRKTQVRSRIKIILDNFKIGIYPFMGLIKNILLFVVPYSVILYLKQQNKT